MVAGAFVLTAALLFTSISSVSFAGAAGITNLGSVPPKASKVGTSKVDFETLATPAAADRITKEEMLNAIPADGPDPSGAFDIPGFDGATASAATGDYTPGKVTSFPNRIHGKIFFKVGDATYSCSGTVIDSKGRNVVITAGHCVYDVETGAYVSPLVFLPGYENGEALGQYFATGLGTTDAWKQGNQSYDIGIITLDTPVQSVYGSRQIAFDLNMNNRQVNILGYPSKPSPRFNGEVLQGCKAAIRYIDNAQSLPYPLGAKPCYMQQGSSGGGWVTLGNYVSSVVSYGYCDSDPRACGLMFGPVFSSAAKGLYQLAGGSSAPTVKLRGAPPKVVRKRKVTFSFTGTAATLIGFRCKLDRQRWVNCSSKISITRLSPGKHTLRVRAVDQMGVQSKKQIVRSFRVKLRR